MSLVSDKSEAGMMSRRQLLKAGAVAGACLQLPGIDGCTTLPAYPVTASSESAPLYLIHGNLIDVVRGILLRDKTLVIRRGMLTAIEGPLAVSDPEAIVVDLKNQFVLPGLIDAHCHTTLTGESELRAAGLATTYRQFKRNYIRQLAHGVTTVRDMGAMPKLLHDGLALIADGRIVGPRVVYCNAFTNIYRGHPDIDPGDVSPFSGLALAFAGDPNLWFKDTRDLEERMAENCAGGASFIKLTMDRASVMCGRGQIPAYSDEHLRIITAFAKRRHLRTAAHVHTKFGFDRVLKYGIDTIEHSLGDAELTDEEVQEMVQKNIAIVPTLMIAQMYAAPEAYPELPAPYRTDFIARETLIRRQYLSADPGDDIEPAIHRTNRRSLENLQKYGCERLHREGKFLARPDLYFDILLRGPGNLLKMKRSGVLIGCGTDSGVPFIYHGTLWREMEMMERIGFTRMEILQCATVNNARILRLDDKIGVIEKGKCADLVVLDENPLERIGACRAPRLVIRDGRIYDVAGKNAGS